LPLELNFLWGSTCPPRKAKLQNRSRCPKKLAVWNRLLSVWKRMETIPNAYGAFGFKGLCLSLKENCKKNMVFMRV
jgi:hypothetical protein